jgi:hypothetical protein
MPQVTRQEIFAQAAKKLRQDFAELSVVPHSGLKGGEAEEIIQNFFKAICRNDLMSVAALS